MSSKKSYTMKNGIVSPTAIIMIAPDRLLKCNDESQSNLTSMWLRHPRTGTGHQFLMNNDGGEVYEVIAFKEDYRSWFIENTIQPDGCLHFVTRVDPVFLILPYLMKAANNSKKHSGGGLYQQIDCILEDAKFSDTKLLSGCNLKDLQLVSNVKGSDDYVVYKYDESLTLEWLKKKVARVSDALRNNQIGTARGSSVAATFVRSSKYADSSNEDYTCYACDLIGEYLDAELLLTLKKHLDVPVTDENENTASTNEPAAKKCRLDEVASPTEDYSSLAEKSSIKKPEKKTVAQRLLGKADTTGMKSLSSFFTAKTTKK